MTPPRLYDVKELQKHLNVKQATAERIMRALPKVYIGRKVYVKEPDVVEYIERSTADVA